jgi:hypothetical protein
VACSLGTVELGHREHVRLAWLYLRGSAFEDGAERFCTNLKRFADAKGKGGLFHATITWAYLALVAERIERAPGCDSFEAFASANPELLAPKGGALEPYYDRATLESPLARRVFLLPRTRP